MRVGGKLRLSFIKGSDEVGHGFVIALHGQDPQIVAGIFSALGEQQVLAIARPIERGHDAVGVK